MKKLKCNITAVTIAMLTLLGGCDKSGSQSETSSDVGGTVGDNSNGDNSSGGNSIVFADFEGEYPENPLSLLTLSKDEICQKINVQPNFQCSDNLYINIPESATVYEYNTYDVHVPQFIYPAAQYEEDFKSVFKYFFSDREMDMDYLKYSKYYGYDDEMQERIEEEGYVKDKDTLPDGVRFTYNEMLEPTSNWNYPVYMELAREIGCGSGHINKGEATYLAGKIDMDLQGNVFSTDRYLALPRFEPAQWFPSVGKYFPQSEKSFNLLDGEMKICDAVKFFEDYINKVPISTGRQRNTLTRVCDVSVLKIGDNTYGYYFHTEPEFQGVCHEQVVYSRNSEYSYDPIGGEAFMIRSDDVDYIHSYYGAEWTFNVKALDSVVPIETAIKAMSDQLSTSVTFDVKTVEFVYVQKYVRTDEGYINIDTYEAIHTPAWRITAHNFNDNHTYICYVDAKDGGNFRYYVSTDISDYDD